MSDPTPMAKASTSTANRLDDISQNEVSLKLECI